LADQGNADGQLCYGVCLRDGDGVHCDSVNASQYFQLSADHGNADGQFYYELCLRTGDGIDRDSVKSAQYFKLRQIRVIPTVNVTMEFAFVIPMVSIAIL
jgi:TPR repeat protein